jgi:hypothetical protein
MIIKPLLNIAIITCSLFICCSCKKDSPNNTDEFFSREYGTGIITFNYSDKTTIDTNVTFTSTGSNMSGESEFGSNYPAIPFVFMMRLNPENYDLSAAITFSGIDINKLTLPYSFQWADSRKHADIDYTTGYKVDSSNNVTFLGYYGSSTRDFRLTILSKNGNRLQGVFSGDAKNEEGKAIHISEGKFDIKVFDK